MENPRFKVIIALILAAGLIRVLPHPPNFAPIAAMALFAGAYVANVRLAFLIPLAAMLLSDLILGFHAGIVLVYVCMGVTVAIGMQLRNRLRAVPIGIAALGSSVLFFIVTNFGVWVTQGMYPMSVEGLVACYVAAIPFFQNSLLGNAFYTVVLFGGFALVSHYAPRLRGGTTTA